MRLAPDSLMAADLNRINRLDGELVEKAFNEALTGIAYVKISILSSMFYSLATETKLGTSSPYKNISTISTFCEE